MDISNSSVVILGIGTVFIGLICLIILCKILGLLFGRKKENSAANPVGAVKTTVQPANIENRGEIIAAVSCAIAEELGTDVSAIRILSFKKL